MGSRSPLPPAQDQNPRPFLGHAHGLPRTRPETASSDLDRGPRAGATRAAVRDRRPADRGAELVSDGTRCSSTATGHCGGSTLGVPRSTGWSEIAHEGLPELNNDHVLDPDGEHIYLSAIDGHIYRAAWRRAVDRVTADEGDWHFLHGVSPDGPAWPTSSSATSPNRDGWRSWNPTADDPGGHRYRSHRRARVVARR